MDKNSAEARQEPSGETSRNEPAFGKAVAGFPCGRHRDERPVRPSIGCEYCGTMLHTKTCEGCKQYFLDWDAKGFDDIIAGPYVTTSGDLACMRCGPGQDREREKAEDEDYRPMDFPL